MKNIFTSFSLILVAVIFCSYLSAQQLEVIEKYSKVRITIHDKTDFQKLQLAGLSLEGMKVEENYLELILSEREIIKLNDIGFSYETLIEDMTKYYQARSRRTETEMKNLEREMKEKYSSGGFGFGSMGGFYTYDEVVSELDTMRMLYSNIITEKYSIGTSIEGRTIWAVKISDNPDVTEGEPEVFYNSIIHANEVAGMMAVIYFMYYLLENYGSDPEITYLVDNRELYFVPVINPDGLSYVEQIAPNGGGMWRKNRRDNGNGCYGIDLNRNFGYMWGYNNIGSSPDPCSHYYRGAHAFSEPETQAIKNFCESHNFLICNNYHTYWNVIFTPWAYNMTQPVDSTVFNNIISLANVFNGYVNWIYISTYEANGDATDWMYGEQVTKPKIIAYETEVGNNIDGVWPPPERIFPLAEENCYLNKVLAWGPGVIDNPSHITIGSLNASYFVPSVDSVHITAIELNPENYNSSVTAYLYDINDSLINEFAMGEISANTFYASTLAPQEENFYYFLLKDEGLTIPSNFFYNKNLRFTTAGPVVLDSITYTKHFGAYYCKTYITNKGDSTLHNINGKLICNDPWVTNINPSTWTISVLPPGISISLAGSLIVSVIDSLFPNYFNFKVNLGVGQWTYWIDSLAVVVGVDYEETFPTEFTLSQNYPNPFNSSTAIHYSIPQRSNVTLKIYDILGNEITTLVNEEKEQGVYSINFDANNLASGLYLYRIRAGSFINTKKMILLK